MKRTRTSRFAPCVWAAADAARDTRPLRDRVHRCRWCESEISIGVFCNSTCRGHHRDARRERFGREA